MDLRLLEQANQAFRKLRPGDSGARRPVHVVYGGAHLFRADVCRKLGEIALRSLAEYAPDADTLAAVTGMESALAAEVYPRVAEKLRQEPVEDYRIDFEDGYGIRPDHEEDAHAEAAAEEAARALQDRSLPPFFGIRIKPLDEELRARSLRTLERFLMLLRERTRGALPAGFVVTLPKVTVVEQVRALVDMLKMVEELRPGADTGVELMMETPQALLSLPELVGAARFRCAAVHFGPYDYTANLGIAATEQALTHPASDFARSMMQVMLAGTGIGQADGPTTILPIPPHENAAGETERAGNRAVVHRAWKLHYDSIRRALHNGFYQGWDLHPAQLPMRYAAVFAFFLEGRREASERLRNFVDQAAQATRIGERFDDAATGQGLLNYFLRAIRCGAIAESEAAPLTGLSQAELRTASFARIMKGRRSPGK
jgi:citrate lyase beta subunit